MAERSSLPERVVTTFLHSTDSRGRAIDPEVLGIARRIAVRAIPYAEGLIKDPALATSLLEEAAASVSRVISRKAQFSKSPISNLEAYLFRAFIRRVNLAKQRELIAASGFPVGQIHSMNGSGYSKELELRIFASEFLTRCDAITRDMFRRRMEGFSWKEIGSMYGMSSHAAESRFHKMLKKVRRKLGLK